jgi:hypothetical protein
MGDPAGIPEIVPSILLSLSPYPLRRGLPFREGGAHGSLITAAGLCHLSNVVSLGAVGAVIRESGMGDVHRVSDLDQGTSVGPRSRLD